jgi:hypothetical protein
MMRRALAVAFLVISIASIALADGSDPGIKSAPKKPPVRFVVG